MINFILTAIVFSIVGYAFVWVAAHQEVKRECERLGAFYVGKEVFDCTKRPNKPVKNEGAA